MLIDQIEISSQSLKKENLLFICLFIKKIKNIIIINISISKYNNFESSVKIF